jgi:hypothetical protein
MQHQLEERHSYYKRVVPMREKTPLKGAGVGGGRESGAEDTGSCVTPLSALWALHKGE